MAVDNIATLGIKVDPSKAIAGSNKSKRAIKGIGTAAKRVKSQIFSLNSALGALGAGMVLRSALRYTASVENLKVQLKYLTANSTEAGKAFESMIGFAKEAPYALQEIQRAAPVLLTVSDDVDEMNTLLEITGDIASSTVLTFEQVAQQLQRTFSGGIAAADLFRDTGVKAMLGFEEGVKYSTTEGKKHILDMWLDGTAEMKGATKDMAKTFDGQVTVMGDAWDTLMLTFMKEGIFDETKTSVEEITAWLTSAKVKQGAKDLGNAVHDVGKEVKDLVGWYMDLPQTLKVSGLVLAVLGGTTGRLALAGVIAFKDEIKEVLHLFDAMGSIVGVTPRSEEGLQMALGLVNEELRQMEPQLKAIEGLWEWAQIPMGWWGSAVEGKPLTTLQKQYIALIEKQQIYQRLLDDMRYAPHLMKAGVSVSYRPDTSGIPKHWKHLVDNESVLAITNSFNALEKGTKGVSTAAHALGTEFDYLSKEGDRWQNRVTVMGEEFLDLAETVNTAQEQIQDFSEGLADNIEDAIMRMTQGLMSFKDVVKNVFRYVAAEMVKIHIAQPLAQSLSNALTGMLFGGSNKENTYGYDKQGGFLGEGLALGGTAQANQPYIVGERGAELFVPNQTGTVVPNNQLGSSQTINVTYAPQVNALDPQTAQLVIAENAPTIVSVIRQAFNQHGTQVAI